MCLFCEVIPEIYGLSIDDVMDPKKHNEILRGSGNRSTQKKRRTQANRKLRIKELEREVDRLRSRNGA